MMAALFSCTKCHARHPFEDLSASEQLCKKCRNNTPVVKCTLCRAEFQQGEKGATSSNCKKCNYNMKTYGKPTVCQYCNLTAAFIANKCQRCASYEKKFGPPSSCEQCKMKCAFDQTESTKKKLDGKILCWLCALAYKRVIAKARQRELKRAEDKKQGLTSNRQSFDKLDKLDKTDKLDKLETMSTGSSGPHSNHGDKSSSSAGEGNTVSKPLQKDKASLSIGERSTPTSAFSMMDKTGSLSFLRDHKEDKSNDSTDKPGKEEAAKEHHRSRGHKSKTHHSHRKSHSGHSPNKKPRLDKSDSNGMTSSHTPTKSLSISSVIGTEKSPVDPNSSEHVIAINRLQEQLEGLKKQLQMKDQQMMEKEKKMTEVKAAQYENEKLFRAKIVELTKKNQELVENHQVKVKELEKKNRDLTKQVSTLSKGKKNSLILNSNSTSNSPNVSS